MSGYNVTTPRLFEVKDPMQLVQFQLSLLNSTFQIPDQPSTIDGGSVTLPAEAMIGGYIKRTSVINGGQDTTDSASNIIAAITTKVRGISNLATVPNGTSFDFKILSDADKDYLYGGAGVTVADGYCSYWENAVTCIRVTITDQASLGPTHSDAVSISQLTW